MTNIINPKKDKAEFVHRNGITADKEYVEWLHELKERYQRGQIKASIKVNSEMLVYYWCLGRDIVTKQAESKWGSGFFNQLSLDMRRMFSNENGFSVTNLKYMKRWYMFYAETVRNHQQVTDEIRHQIGDEFKMPTCFGYIPWRHHIQIFTKSKSVNEALFYINKVITEGWSRSKLENKMADNLYKTQGTAITNFDSVLPEPQSLLAKELLKNKYNLSFISAKDVEQEKDLEEALAKNVTQFLLELGKGFAYLGKQQELRIDNETVFFPDLLFYHIPQRRYVIIELKAVKFMPEFAGKLNFYVTAADKLLRGNGDNPSVGLLICKTAKKTIVEWSLQDIQKPLGVATYQLQKVVNRTIEEFEQDRKNAYGKQ